MGQSDNMIPGGIDLEALHRLVGAPKAPEQRALSGLDDLLEVMHQVARGVVDFNAIEIGPDACRELVNLIDQGEAHRQAADACSRLVDQARDERDSYLAKLSEVAAARDREQARADVAKRDLASALDKLAQAEDAHRRSLNHAENGRYRAKVDRDCAYVRLAQAHEEITGLRAERDEAQAEANRCRHERDKAQAALGVAERERNDLAARFADLSELVLDDADGEPPRHLHCCECEQCQPPQRGVVVINIFRAEGHCATINVGGKGEG